MDERLSKYFWLSELKCPCCDKYMPNAELLEVLDDIREHFNTPTFINSSTRCKWHNKEVGGANRSRHLLGEAGDVRVSGVPASKVYDYVVAKYPNKYGIGKYNSFTHIDVRSGKGRW